MAKLNSYDLTYLLAITISVSLLTHILQKRLASGALVNIISGMVVKSLTFDCIVNLLLRLLLLFVTYLSSTLTQVEEGRQAVGDKLVKVNLSDSQTRCNYFRIGNQYPRSNRRRKG